MSLKLITFGITNKIFSDSNEEYNDWNQTDIQKKKNSKNPKNLLLFGNSFTIKWTKI